MISNSYPVVIQCFMGFFNGDINKNNNINNVKTVTIQSHFSFPNQNFYKELKPVVFKFIFNIFSTICDAFYADTNNNNNNEKAVTIQSYSSFPNQNFYKELEPVDFKFISYSYSMFHGVFF